MAQTSPTEVSSARPAGQLDLTLLDVVLQVLEHRLARWVLLFLISWLILGQLNYTGITERAIRADELGWQGRWALDLAFSLGPEFDPASRTGHPDHLHTAVSLVNWGFAAVIALAATLNFWLISLIPLAVRSFLVRMGRDADQHGRGLPFTIQTGVMWAELVLLFIWFFLGFDLDFDFIAERTPHLIGLALHDGFLQGAALTLFICVVSIVASTIIALIAALARLSNNGAAFGIATFYTSFFRGTPLLLQLVLIYSGLPQLGVVIDALTAGIIAVSLCYGAYMAEIFRAGILAIPRGQTEAALSLGLTKGRTMQLVILPQAMRLIIPPTGNQFIAMLKDSSLVSVLGAWELMYLARTHGRSEFKVMEMLIVAAVIYWLLSFAFELLQARIERKFGKGVRVS